MDSKIVRALQQLGLSDERISSFATIVDGVKERVRSEGLVYRQAKPAAKAAKPKPRTIRVSYAPGQPADASYSARAAATVAVITRPKVIVKPAPRVGPSLAERAAAIGRSTDAMGPTVAGEIQRLERLLNTNLPVYRRLSIEARLHSLSELGDSIPGAASKTVAGIEGSQRKWQRTPRRGLRT